MNDNRSSGRGASLLKGKLKLSVFCSFAVLAAPAASTCGPPAATWCEVKPIVAAKCANCHANPPPVPVPVAIVTYAHTQANSVEVPGSKVWQSMLTKLNANLMPPAAGIYPTLPAPVALTQAEKDTITAWLNAGAPAPTDQTCLP